MLVINLLIILTLNNISGIHLWVDREQPVYEPGDNLKVFFEVEQDCYVAIYDIEVGGEKHLLFPQEDQDGWVESGRIYELPPQDADYDYLISGPEGEETIIGLASFDHLPSLDEDAEDIIQSEVVLQIKEPDPAKLRIISTPPYCRIYLTNVELDEKEYIGKTPRTMVLRPGTYIVKIKKAGYHTLTRRIWLEPGDRRRVFVKLIPY